MDRLLKMSAKELNRLEVMQRLSEKRMSQREAGRILDLSTRLSKRRNVTPAATGDISILENR